MNTATRAVDMVITKEERRLGAEKQRVIVKNEIH